MTLSQYTQPLLRPEIGMCLDTSMNYKETVWLRSRSRGQRAVTGMDAQEAVDCSPDF